MPNLTEVEIDGDLHPVLEWEVFQAPGAPGDLRIRISGTVSFNAPPFPFNGELWYLTAGITKGSAGAIEMELRATNKIIPRSGPAPSPALPPKSRPHRAVPKSAATLARALGVDPAMAVDQHENCVPLDHYNDLKTFIAMELNVAHGGMLMVPDAILNAWSDWRVLHSKDEYGAHTFIAVDPSVVISEEVADDEEIPF